MKKVKIYSTSTCPNCARAKEYFRVKEIKFEEIDLTENQEEAEKLIKKTGYTSVPQIEIDGKIIVGFDPKEIENLIKN